MTGPTAYTHLESLLLFQALRSDDAVTSSTFNRISDLLKNIPLVRNDPTYDHGRLSPDALRELYLGLLKEEARSDIERRKHADSGHVNNNHNNNGNNTHNNNNNAASSANGDADVVQASRKRKAASPGLPTVHEATQHAHLIPQLVNRLYARFRDNAIRQIREQERKYAAVTREIAEIEAGQWDARLQKQKLLVTQSPKPSSRAHTHPDPNRTENISSTSTSDAATLTPQAKAVQGNDISSSTQLSPAKVDIVANEGPEAATKTIPEPLRPHPIASQIPPFNAASPSHHTGVAPKRSSIAQAQVPHVSNVSNHAFPHSPSPANQSPLVHQHGHPPAPAQSSQQVSQSFHASSTPLRTILPPPVGPQLASNAPPQNVPSPRVNGPHMQQYQQQQQQQPQIYPVPQNRLNPGLAAVDDLASRGYPGTPGPHQAGGYHSPTVYQDRRGPFPQPHQQHTNAAYPATPTHSGGVMLQPFHTTPQEPNRSVSQQHLRSQQLASQTYGVPHPLSLRVNAPATAPRLPPQVRSLSKIVDALATPVRRRPRPQPLWRLETRPSTGTKPKSQSRPLVEPLSPTQVRGKSPTLPSRADTQGQPAPPPKGKPGRRKRERSAHSVVSSVVDDTLLARTRSHSVSTVVDANTSIEDRRGSKANVKAEPSTPAASTHDDTETTMAAPTTTLAGRPLTRKRRGTMHSQTEPPSKKSRQESVPPDESHEHQPHQHPSPPPPPPRNNKVLATRNFARMSSTVMNDIDSHKHASYFKTAVREKDAPGYSTIILQPQNLKSIRTAITAGTRAIAAATAASTAANNNIDSPSATNAGGSSSNSSSGTTTLDNNSTTVELNRTPDLEPPRAIVNGAQLEKEVMRMLANAWMFNPGEDGMAEITKEMFADVAVQMGKWRGTEKGGRGNFGGVMNVVGGERGGAGSVVEEGEGSVEDGKGNGKRRK